MCVLLALDGGHARGAAPPGPWTPRSPGAPKIFSGGGGGVPGLSPRGATAPAASLGRPVDYPVESFTDAERERLRPHFTNLDRPVFALVNLPETVKAALFARYSRYPGTLRRLFLDEFADDLPDSAALRDQGEGK